MLTEVMKFLSRIEKGALWNVQSSLSKEKKTTRSEGLLQVFVVLPVMLGKW